ncbi:MAG TPA: cupin domain-containing protein [Saprospiraceae bacterium]|nr:cupin domain-containing protein [Saprospiraceae bacterium]HPN69147.1 cupin domain-containing protein [Saprospiraceae bacterium]
MKQHVNLSEIIQEIGQVPRKYHEFIRTKDLSTGIYKIAVGQTDIQTPHAEDEVYYIIQGKSKFIHGSAVLEVKSGDFLFVAATVEHRFIDVEEDMIVLVFFGPAEGNNK